ncbi:50S ribosomal protein L17 [Chryseosolibacter indicus]|uniref:Large ribosomal subunit protein bL17 n=1 Tax=Chryseosolibacter indicus TaxID=2782351 RepID=A0ABS5VMP5_9BACT|nr:50S ribosomal protein L17 [Chryseosolibacter indicus]MBT1702110.1 50S ribosomal protein L17 [Chryseosolibacter indicus]
MRHGKKVNHLGRKTAHRQALLSNLASSLILNKRITTTVAKAKALRKYVEPLLTKSKEDTTHSRRVVFSYLGNKESVKTLFGEVASKIAERPGGYTRIVKLADTRQGDNAEMCLMELVDFNTLYTKDGVAKKATTRRSRAKKKKETTEGPAAEGTQEATETQAEAKPKKTRAKKEKE